MTDVRYITMSFHKKTHYETDFIKSIQRKILYTKPVYLIDIKFGPEKKIGKSESLDIKLPKTIGQLFTHENLSDEMVRLIREFCSDKQTTSADDVVQYLLDNHKNSNEMSMNNNLTVFLNNLLPVEFYPEKILDICSSEKSRKILSERFPKARIDSEITDLDYDLIIASQCIYRMPNSKAKHDLIRTLTDRINLNGFIILADYNINNKKIETLAKFVHDIVGKLSQDTTEICYSSKDQILNWVSAEMSIYIECECSLTDPKTNPLNYYALSLTTKESE